MASFLLVAYMASVSAENVPHRLYAACVAQDAPAIQTVVAATIPHQGASGAQTVVPSPIPSAVLVQARVEQKAQAST